MENTKKAKPTISYLLICCLVAVTILSCSSKNSSFQDTADPGMQASLIEEVEIKDESLPLASSSKTVSGNNAVIDYSASSQGYVKVKYSIPSSNTIKALVKGPKTQYQYTIKPKTWATLPLSEGNGSYQIGIYERDKGTMYRCTLSKTISVKLKSKLSPFQCSNIFVNYASAKNTIKQSKKLCAGVKTNAKKIEKVYNYVVKNLKYDKNLAESVSSDYIPDLDSVLKTKKGICFDYAALMAGMLRKQGVPCKVVVGYAGSAYHAWVSAYLNKKGKINGTSYKAKTWVRLDPTFASTAKRTKDKSILKYIEDGKNYKPLLYY